MNATELHPDSNVKPGTIPGASHNATHSFQYEQGLPPREVHRRAGAAAAMLGRAGRALGAWLVEIDDRKLYRHFSCSSVYHYASRYLNLAGHTVAEHLRTGRRLAELPLLASAYEKGELSATHVREITRVATADTENFWCETAKRSSTRTIEKLVAFTPKGGLPVPRPEIAESPGESGAQSSRSPEPCHPGPGSSAEITSPGSCSNTDAASPGTHSTAHLPGCTSPRQGIPPQGTDWQGIDWQGSGRQGIATRVRYHDRLVVELTAEDMAILKDAFQKARRESGRNDRRSHLIHMARAFLQGPPREREDRDRGREGQGSPKAQKGQKREKPPYQVLIHHHLPSGLTWCETEKGERPIPRETFEKALCDGEMREAEETIADSTRYREKEHDPAAGHEPLSPTPPLKGCDGHQSSFSQKPQPAEGLLSPMEYVSELYGRMKHAHAPGSRGGLKTPGSSRSRNRQGSHGESGSSRRARRTLPSKVRKKVLERDSHCCAAPGCGSTLFTVVHHLDPAALGGSHDLHRLITLCRGCHDLVHEGRLTVKGDAPESLVWGG